MPRLKDRNRQIPGSMGFYIAPLKWRSQPWSSFDTIVNEALAVLRANPHVAQNLGWALTYDSIAEKVDEMNASVCKAQGWTDYYVEGGMGGPSAAFPFPRQPSSLLGSLKNVVVGSETIVHWLSSGAEAVPAELSEKRAGVCAACPMNQQGDLTRFFTVPASNAIRAAINTRSEWKLSTTQDEKLSTCSVCSCPLKLLVHCPIAMKMSKIPANVFGNLPGHCWVKIEANEKGIKPSA
jgi:hypothetical protein